MTIQEKRNVKEFFQALFQGTRGYIELRTITNEKKVEQFFYSTLDVSRMVGNLTNDYENAFKNTNVYFGVCPRNKRIGKEKNVKQVNCLWADLDCRWEQKPNEPTREERLKALKVFEPKPSIIVNSGHGYQVYWLLEAPFLIKTIEDKLHTKGIVKGLAIALKGDTTFDLNRVLRVPGTKNVKNPKNPPSVEILEFNPALRYDLSGFQEYKVDVEDVTIADVSLSKLGIIPDRFWRILEKDPKIKTTWHSQRDFPSRSEYDMSLARLLMPYGFTDSEIAAILKASPSGKGKDAKLPYLAHTIGKTRINWKERRKIASEKVESTKKERKEQPSNSKFNPRPYSEEVLAHHHLKYDKYKRFWIYNKNAKIWESEAEPRLNSILRQKTLGKQDYKRYCVAEIIADLQGLTYADKQIQEPGAHLIPFKNKIYNLENEELLDYSPDYFFINKLAVSIHTENGECPTINRIFEELVEPEDVITLYEILAYTLYRHYPYPKLFILYGSGANGKTTYINILGRFLGTENISLVGANDLQFNRFSSSQLFGKLLNVSGEMDYTILKNTSRLKQCCGEDLIYCERKFREPFPFVNYAKMVFLTNQVPLTADKTRAFYRRVFLLEFPNSFILGENADPMLVEKIPEEEFEGLAWKCLNQLKQLCNRDFVFTNHSTTEDVTRQYEDLSNPLNKFLDENTEKDVNTHIAVGEFNDKYLTYLTNNGLRVWTPKEIGRAMKEKDFEQKSLSSTNEDNTPTTVRNWLGLKWK